jgi:chromate reductase
MTRILALSGSLRQQSSSNLILRVIATLAPNDVEIQCFDSLGDLPHFNDPKVDPASVHDFKQKIKEADAVLICTPEYAFGIPGTLKNAIDWCVGTGEFVNKPVGLVTASSQGEKGHAALLLVLSAISANVIGESSLLISFVRAKIDKEGNVKDTELLDSLKRLTFGLRAAADEKKAAS